MKYRKINSDDRDLIYRWANDPVTRDNSYSSKKITYEEHSKWFKDKVNDDSCHFLIFYTESANIGFVRFDKDEEDDWVISINIAPDQRGKGLSSTMLEQAMKYIKSVDDKPIKAYIKETNPASKKAFEKAGFTLADTLMYKQSKSYMYICR